MGILYFLSVYVHILAAAAWLGGMMFLILVLLPAIKDRPDRVSLILNTGLKFRFAGWIALTILLITGLYNLHVRGIPLTIAGLTSNNYNRLIGVKILIFIIIVMISAMHDFYFGTKATEALKNEEVSPKMRRLSIVARWIGRLNFLLALIAVAIGVIIVRGFWF